MPISASSATNQPRKGAASHLALIMIVAFVAFVAFIASMIPLSSCSGISGDIPVVLDEAFAALHPALSESLLSPSGIARIAREKTVPKSDAELALPGTVRLSAVSGALDRALADSAAKRGRDAATEVAIASPLVAIEYIENIEHIDIDDDEHAAEHAAAPPQERRPVLIVPFGGSFANQVFLPAEKSIRAEIVPVDYDPDPAYAEAGRAVGRYIGARRSSGDGNAACAILFAQTGFRPSSALDAFVSAYRTEMAPDGTASAENGSGENGPDAAMGLYIGRLGQGENESLDPEGEARAVLSKFPADFLRVIFVAADRPRLAVRLTEERPAVAIGFDSGDKPAVDFADSGFVFTISGDAGELGKMIKKTATEAL
ncbi:MAG: hypothetical protein ABFC75_04305, partial [Rectinema sp.]